MPLISETEASKSACPWNNFSPCLGKACMAWAWERPYPEKIETDNLIETPQGLRPSDNPPPSPGEGWIKDGHEREKGYHQSAKLGLPKARSQWWVRPVEITRGWCGRIPRCHGGYDDYPF